METRRSTSVFLAAFYGLAGVLGFLPPPRNVRILSEDMGLILLWDPPHNTTSSNNTTYTTELKGSMSNYKACCVGQSQTSCNATSEVSQFGQYELRVRAESQTQHSDWVATDKLFLMDDMTNISAPGVRLLTRHGEIEVQITDPPLHHSTLQEVYSPVKYTISYWQEQHTHKRFVERSGQTHVVLRADQLIAATSYCVQVQMVFEVHNKTSATSNATCILNSTNERLEAWQVVLLMLGSFLLVGLSVLTLFLTGWKSYRLIRYINPKARLSEDYFKKACESTQPLPGQPMELYHQLSIVCEAEPEAPLLAKEVNCSSNPQPSSGQRSGLQPC